MRAESPRAQRVAASINVRATVWPQRSSKTAKGWQIFPATWVLATLGTLLQVRSESERNFVEN